MLYFKVTVEYAGVERSRIIKDDSEKAALKAIVNSASPKTVTKNLSKSDKYL